MVVQLGDTAADFTANTTAGVLSLHEHLDDGWGILFSHPADFTPVCTTELGELARSSVGRNVEETVRVLDAAQLTQLGSRYAVSTPANWTDGADVIVSPAVSDDEAQKRFPTGYRTLKPYPRLTPQPNK